MLHKLLLGVIAIAAKVPGTWSQGGNSTTARSYLAGAGTQSAGLSFGGAISGSYSALTEEYDGTSWTSATDLPNATGQLAGCSTQSAALAFGGYIGSTSSLTEEYDKF